MTIGEWLETTIHKLRGSGIDTARLDALVLLEDCLRRDRALLLAHLDDTLTGEQQQLLGVWLRRRMQHEPLAYIRGRSEFYGREFRVDCRVLVPRPETETMIDLLKQLEPTDGTTIVDVGTGSGALAVSASLELPGTAVLALDIDEQCLQCARANAAEYRARITLLAGDLLEPLAGSGLTRPILLCNLPYVPDGYQINQAARHEPGLALFAGADGLDLYRKLFDQLQKLNIQPAYILTESLIGQHDSLAGLAAAHGYIEQQREGLVQSFAPTSS